MLLIFDDKEKSLSLRLDKTEAVKMAVGLLVLILGPENIPIVQSVLNQTRETGDIKKLEETFRRMPHHPNQCVDFVWKINVEMLLKLVID